jgi:integrase
MLSYCAKKNKLNALELKMRKIVQHYSLIAANSGLRVGEQRQLRWSDVQVEARTVGGKEQKLAKIIVRAETSKVPTTRTLLCRNGLIRTHFSRHPLGS